MIAIIGAGLTGLSTARHLGRRRAYTLFEQQDAPGGLCRSPSADGFTFDHTGHLLHLRDPYTRDLAATLLRGRLLKIERKAAVYCRGRYLPFPFQAHLHGLPPAQRLECLQGFIRAAALPKQRPPRVPRSFHDWVLAAFGPGIARHFFLPYNEKLFCRSPKAITAEWTAWSVPRPSLEEVLRGALGMANPEMGYNASFWYPERGGIQILPEALTAGIRELELGRRLTRVRLKQRMLEFHDGTEVGYDRLVSTMPLPALLQLLDRLPPRLSQAARRLSASTVHNLNIGINRPAASPYHWIYFPEPEFPFYRVGFYSNFSPAMAPPHTSSLYVEIAARAGERRDCGALRDAALDGLRRCGILRRGDRIVAEQYNCIEPGYVLYDAHRHRQLPQILRWLKGNGIISSGRYGAWTYCSMEDNILEGRALAGALA